MEKERENGDAPLAVEAGVPPFRASARTGAPCAQVWVVATEPVNKHFVNFTSELYKLSIDWLYVGF